MTAELPILNDPAARLEPSAVINAMMVRTGFGRAALLSREGSYHEIVWARHELTWLLREYVRLSLARIGHVMGGRDAKTIQHSLRRVAQRAAADPGYRQHVWALAAFVAAHSGGDQQPAGNRDVVLLMLRAVLSSDLLSDAEARQAAVAILEDRHA